MYFRKKSLRRIGKGGVGELYNARDTTLDREVAIKVLPAASNTVDPPKGSAPGGIEWSDVEAKYRTLMPESRLPAKRIEESLKVTHDFDQLKRMSQLTNLLA